MEIIETIFSQNLWMFVGIGLLGFALCWFRYQFVRGVVPIVILLSVLFFFNAVQGRNDVGVPDQPPEFLRNVLLAILFALALPAVGAYLDYRRKHQTL